MRHVQRALRHCRYRIEFNLVAIMQLAHGDNRSRRSMAAEELGIDRIDLGPVTDIGNVDGDTKYQVAPAAGSDEDGIEIGEGLLGLFFDAADAVFLLTRFDGKLASDINHTLMDDGLRIVACRYRGLVGEDWW